ncbi:MAG: ribosome small subunit-dependent GTPase A [Bacteroidales bacterium]|nr:ribosome small subunit-dependent GTPase A [Bacteroidales bacterium]
MIIINLQGIVVKSTGSWYIVQTDDNQLYNCKIKGKFKTQGIKSTNPIAVGDKVDFILQKEEGVGLIKTIHPRKNYLIRKATKLSSRSHIIAANVDYAILVVSLAFPRTSSGFIDRFLISTEAYHIETLIVFNKSDLHDKVLQNQLNEWMTMYENIGYSCYSVSAKTGKGVDALKKRLQNKINLFSGHSGVGKSALINAIQPDLKLKTAIVSDATEKGTHTTTFAEMHAMHSGGYIIDTPGIKGFGLIDFVAKEIPSYFKEFAPYASQCKFHNCTHTHEPDCAVIKAANSGAIAKSRYNNYLAIIKDDYFSENPY